MNTETILMIGAALLAGIVIGKAQTSAAATATAAAPQPQQAADWWAFAGSWA